MLFDAPFYLRLLTLTAVLGLVAIVELAFRGRKATRWRAYLFLFVVGTCGGLFGLCCDAITANLSPEYFVLGKGISPGPGFWRKTLTLGYEAGFSVGVVAAAVALFANSHNLPRASLPYAKLFKKLLVVLPGALTAAPIGALLGRLDPFGLSPDLAGLSAQQAQGFLLVHGTHIGIYTGALMALIFAIGSIVRARARRGRR